MPPSATGPVDPTRTPPGSLAGSAPPRATGSVAVGIEISGGLEGGVDQVARNAIDDITTFWKDSAPAVFGAELTDLSGGYHSVDPSAPSNAPCLTEVADVAGNAFYCPRADAIVYDRVYLARIAADYSDLDVALTLAHEFGHALQRRFPTADATKSITLETQADCYAGAWAQWVTEGRAGHFTFSAESLDRVLGDYVWEMGDPAGTDPNHEQAHGSVFDRVSAMQEGYLDGAAACVADFSDRRSFVARKFTQESRSTDGRGNISLTDAIGTGSELLGSFWTDQQADGAAFRKPEVLLGDAACPVDRYIGVCPSSPALGVDPLAAVGVYHDRIGDFATVTALSLAYAQYAGLARGTPLSPVQRICATGVFAASLLAASPSVLSPGDLDEAVQLLLVAGPDNKLVDTGTVSAWDRLDAFRSGVFGGLPGCSR